MMLFALLRELDKSDTELELMYIQSLVTQMFFCDVIAAVIRLSHIEHPIIPEGRFNRNNLMQPYQFLFQMEMEEFDELHHQLRMPAVFRTSARYAYLSTEALHIVLRCFAFPCRWGDLVQLSHRSEPALSAIFHNTMAWILEHYKHLLNFDAAHFAHLLPDWVWLHYVISELNHVHLQTYHKLWQPTPISGTHSYTLALCCLCVYALSIWSCIGLQIHSLLLGLTPLI